MKNKKEWSRKCPNPDNNLNCKNIIHYSYKSTWKRAINNNSICNSCKLYKHRNPMKQHKVRKKVSIAMSGKNHPMFGRFGKDHPAYGKSWYNLCIKKMGKELADKKLQKRNDNIKNTKKQNPIIFTEQHKQKLSISHKGKVFSDEHKKKIRLSIIKNIENRVGQLMPNYNPSSIPILKAKAKELGITDLQHAENGGEYHIKELGYWVDGYSEEKNIVIEYYESFHEKQKERDERRKQEIIEFLGCKFIEIKE